MPRLRGPSWAETWSPGKDRYYTWRFARFLRGFHTSRTAQLPGPWERCRSLREAEGIPYREQALAIFAGAPRPWRVLHGDLHHYNLMRHGRRTLALDPHGWRGPPLAEVGAFLGNPLDLPHVEGASALLRRRVEVLAVELGVSQEDVARWGFAHAVLGWAWSLEDGEDPSHWQWVADQLSQVVKRA